jgi:CRAL/TRIO domain
MASGAVGGKSDEFEPDFDALERRQHPAVLAARAKGGKDAVRDELLFNADSSGLVNQRFGECADLSVDIDEFLLDHEKVALDLLMESLMPFARFHGQVGSQSSSDEEVDGADDSEPELPTSPESSGKLSRKQKRRAKKLRRRTKKVGKKRAKAANELMLPFPLHSPYLERFLVLALYYRKFDLARVHEMLKLQTAFRRDNNFVEALPFINDVNMDVFDCGMVYGIPGARAKCGGHIVYLKFSKYTPKEWDLPDLMVWVANYWSRLMQYEGMDGHRNGLVGVYDMAECGWANFDMTSGRATAVIQDTFPMRYQSLLILNAPGIIRAVMRAFRLFMKAQMMDRIQMLDSEEQLLDHIDADQLSSEFGGSLEVPDSFYRTTVDWARQYDDIERNNDPDDRSDSGDP